MPDTSQSATATVARWRAAVENADAEAALACLSPDVALYSPLTDQYRLEGTDEVRDFLTAAFAAVKDINFHTETGEGNSYVVAYRAQVGSQPFEEAQLLLLDDEARIIQIKLFGRPLPALTALMITIGPRLARQQGRHGLPTLLRASSAPIHAMVSIGDRTLVPRTRPRSQSTDV